jgi:hypothetical protein
MLDIKTKRIKKSSRKKGISYHIDRKRNPKGCGRTDVQG